MRKRQRLIHCTLEMIAGTLPQKQRRWLRHGPNCIRTNCWWTGICSIPAGLLLVAPHTLRVVFDDATQQLIDFEPVLRGELYGPLRDQALFNQVTVDSEVPAILHEWPH